VHRQRLLRVGGDLRGGLLRGGGADAAGPEHAGQFGLLGAGVMLEFQPFLVDLGEDELVLRGDGDVLPGRHRARARDQAGQAGEHDRVRARAAAAHPGDQRHVGDQAVHGAEHGRPQPAAGHVAMVVAMTVIVGLGPDRVLGSHRDSLPSLS
jgi:hypothetical protein